MYNIANTKNKLIQLANDPKYKSELCKNFIMKGKCDYGTKCRFAHGIEDLCHNNKKVIKSHAECQSFNILSFCPKGNSCDLTHKESESFIIKEDENDDVIAALKSNYKPFSENIFKRLNIFEKLSDCSSTASNSRRGSISE